MQLDEDNIAILNYPADDPDFIPPENKDRGDKLITDVRHFSFRSRTHDFLPVLITEVNIRDRQPGEGDEIGVFVADTLCVGACAMKSGDAESMI